MWDKYYKKHHPIIARESEASQVWRKMISVREEVEQEIWWQIKLANSSFWFDNWTKMGASYFLENDVREKEELEVKKFVSNGEWDRQKLIDILSEEIIDHIIENISPILVTDTNNTTWWITDMTGSFSVKSAYGITRAKRDDQE